MERKDRKALAAAVAVLLVLGMSSGANALTITSLSAWLKTTVAAKVSKSDLSVSFVHNDGKYEARKDDLKSHLRKKHHLKKKHLRHHFVKKTPEPCDQDDVGQAVPEPSAALVFGLGLFVASRFNRRKR